MYMLLGVAVVTAFVFGVIYLLICADKASQDRRAASAKKQEENDKIKMFEEAAQRCFQIIHESVEIINKSKNPETIASRCDVMLGMFKQLLESAPPGSKINIDFAGKTLMDVADLEVVKAYKTMRLAIHFKNQVESELRKAEILSDPKMKIAQYKKALNEALASVDYLPENPEIKQIVGEIEKRIVLLQSPTAPQ